MDIIEEYSACEALAEDKFSELPDEDSDEQGEQGEEETFEKLKEDVGADEIVEVKPPRGYKATDDEIIEAFREELEALNVSLGQRFRRDIKKIVKCDISRKRKSRSKLPRGTTPTTVVIDGKERTYVYRSSAMRNLFKSYQRKHYKHQCKEYDIEHIVKMFDYLANHYWKDLSAEEKDKVIEDKEEVDLFDYYLQLDVDGKREVFGNNTYYCMLIDEKLNKQAMPEHILASTCVKIPPQALPKQSS